MPLLSLHDITFTWGGPPLLDGVSLDVEPGDRIGLLGRNGTGKSTLMRIMAGEVDPDDGEVRRSAGARLSRLIQDLPSAEQGTVAEIVEAGCLEQAETRGDDPGERWKTAQSVDSVLSRMSLDKDAAFASLSSGMKRRVLLARAIVTQPQIMLLDEPTNHLDIESISWLERFLAGYSGTLVFVTHDRVFLQALATRIVEIDRGRLFDWTCDYTTFLKRKQELLEAEEKQNAAFDRKLAREEVWIRQGIKARRTRNEGRVRAMKAMREDRRRRRQRIGTVRMNGAESEQSGRLVIEATDVSFGWGEAPIVLGFSALVTRGDRLGIIGPNGSGKTTLLKLLLRQVKPRTGTIRHGTRLEVIYFDQLREQIDEDKTVVENVGEGQEILQIGDRTQHIYGYLQDFLFTPERARRAARYLSGGERNRLMLARMFKRPSNVMVLDEPTNDLDAETLELLEELVINYTGTLLVVSHDRAFLNNVVTGVFAFEGDGVVKEYDGGYDDYVRQRTHHEEIQPETKPQQRPSAVARAKAVLKLSYKEQRELEALPDRIAQIEQRQGELHDAMADPSFFKQAGAEINAANVELRALDSELTELFARWEELEARAQM